MKTFFMTIAFAAACLLGVGIGRFSYSEELPKEAVLPKVSAATEAVAPRAPQKGFRSMAEKALPSVVCVRTAPKSEKLLLGKDSDAVHSASGIILSKDGYILTAHHVAQNTNTPIYVTLADQTETTAHLMWAHEALNLAIIKIRAQNLVAATLPENADVSIGEPVLAVESSPSPYAHTVSAGIICAKNQVVATTSNNGETHYTEELLQTDAAAIGYDGGALLNLQGELVGITTGQSDTDGISLAVPIQICLPVILSFIQTGTFHSIDFGITCHSREVTSYLTKAEEGLLITDVRKNSPAEIAGLMKHDILLSVNDQTPGTMADLYYLNFQTPTGSVLSVTYKRDGITYRTEMTVMEEAM